MRYHIRIRNNFKVFSLIRQKQVTAWHLFNNLKVGELGHYQGIVKMYGQLCYLSGTRTIKDGKIEYLILVCFNQPDQALEYYGKCWQVETLFRGLKSSGFNIEDTHVIALDRLEKLMLLVMIAFVWCYKIGDFIDNEIRPIRIKKHGRRALSVCKYGLDYLSRVLLTGYNELNINLWQFLSCT
ncbi:transposase [Gillisia sp. Hel_I_86]|uniref:transposase n=1 Tax=Gillisia sp. Hel_I_86 TaxID=1249981 RepID=UPI00119D602E|nr:transposase [Gillisia sp. Hel_I_86]